MYKMMIVEDELFVRIGLEHAVNWADYGIQLLPSASNGREALELYEQYHPHLILTDISMPEIGGLELIRRIRNQDKTVKFIVLTCLEDYQTAKQVLNLSVSHYYNKSELDIEELKTYITGIIAELDQQGTPRGEESPQAAPKNGLKEWNAFFFEGKPCPFEELLAPYKQPGSAYILARVDFQKMGRVHFEFVRRVLEEILEQQKSGHCLAVSEKFAAVLYVLGAPSPEQQYEQLHRYIQHLKQSMQDYLNITVQVTAGAAFADLEEFPNQWEEVVRRTTSADPGLLPEEQFASQRILAALQYIREHLAENLTLPVVAEQVNFSPGYLSTLMKQELSIGFGEFVLNVRVRKAKQLLAQGNEPLSSIAEQTGFHDASYLIKAFKRVTGLTPNEYRQQYDARGRRKE